MYKNQLSDLGQPDNLVPEAIRECRFTALCPTLSSGLPTNYLKNILLHNTFEV